MSARLKARERSQRLQVCRQEALAATREADSDDDADAEARASKKKRKLEARLKITELKQSCPRPEVVEVWDVTAQDPRLLVYLKARPGLWCPALGAFSELIDMRELMRNLTQCALL